MEAYLPRKLEKLNLVLKPLNQIYSDRENEITSYSQLYDHAVNFFINCLKQIPKFENIGVDKFHSVLSSISEEDFYEKGIEWLNNEVNSLLTTNFELDFSHVPFLENCAFIGAENVLEMFKNYSLIIAHTNMFHLWLDYMILKTQNLHIYFSFIVNEKIHFSENPKNFIFFDNSLETLHHYHLQGCWTVYITHYIFTSLEIEKANSLTLFNEDNEKYIQNYGHFFTFSTMTFFQLNYYINLIYSVNPELERKVEKKILYKKISEINPLRVLVLYKIIFKSNDFFKAMHYISNEKVLFLHYIGDTDFSEYGEIHASVIKLVNLSEVGKFKSFIEKYSAYLKQNPQILNIVKFNNLPFYISRDLMIDKMNKFCSRNEILELGKKYNTCLKVPKTFPSKLSDIINYEDFLIFLKKKELNLPLIIKFSSDVNSSYSHLMIIIISDEGLKNFCEYIKIYSEGHSESIYKKLKL
jgi:hypothetical protein